MKYRTGIESECVTVSDCYSKPNDDNICFELDQYTLHTFRSTSETLWQCPVLESTFPLIKKENNIIKMFKNF